MYDGIIKDQLKKDVIEKVDENSIEGDLKHYVPHHRVITPNNTTTKLRIVYDASAKAKKNNISLNECLYRGPVILEDLCALLLRFRTHKIVVVADIEKAFHQVGLKETDRDVTRYLWLKDVFKPFTEENLEIFRFTRILFGVISSPFIFGSTIRHHLQKENNPVADKLAKDLYVDYLITGENTEEEVFQIYNYAKKTFQKMSMILREWSSNSSTLQQVFKEEDKYK